MTRRACVSGRVGVSPAVSGVPPETLHPLIVRHLQKGIIRSRYDAVESPPWSGSRHPGIDFTHAGVDFMHAGRNCRLAGRRFSLAGRNSIPVEAISPTREETAFRKMETALPIQETAFAVLEKTFLFVETALRWSRFTRSTRSDSSVDRHGHCPPCWRWAACRAHHCSRRRRRVGCRIVAAALSPLGDRRMAFLSEVDRIPYAAIIAIG
jgi:hypothetical protein